MVQYIHESHRLTYLFTELLTKLPMYYTRFSTKPYSIQFNLHTFQTFFSNYQSSFIWTFSLIKPYKIVFLSFSYIFVSSCNSNGHYSFVAHWFYQRDKLLLITDPFLFLKIFHYSSCNSFQNITIWALLNLLNLFFIYKYLIYWQIYPYSNVVLSLKSEILSEIQLSSHNYKDSFDFQFKNIF